MIAVRSIQVVFVFKWQKVVVTALQIFLVAIHLVPMGLLIVLQGKDVMLIHAVAVQSVALQSVQHQLQRP
jgi:hypothetical protein